MTSVTSTIKIKTNAARMDGEQEATAKESGDEVEDFFFESDHLALRGNEDYRSVMRAIVILEAQRIEATKHIDRIAEAQRDALRDPDALLQKLRTGQSLELPNRIDIHHLPEIDFRKYDMKMPPKEASLPSVETSQDKQTDSSLIIRGRTFDQSKPETFNQLWTCEEQRRLEELLIEFPPEPIEMRRFTKIAHALGNRTPRQVASRLQKYFQKLHAAGLPVPGRIPRNTRSTIKRHRHQKNFIRPTTFFPSNFVPVNITDEDDDGNARTLDPSYYRNGCKMASNENELTNLQQNGDENDVVVVDVPSDTESNDTERSDNDRMARLIRRVRRDKAKKYSQSLTVSEHDGYKCNFCGEEPIAGTRWHCATCKHESIDFCSDCIVVQLQMPGTHWLTHSFIGLRVATELKSEIQSEDDSDEGNDFYDNEMSESNRTNEE